ncbi:MAG: serpin family protein [Oscillospiraceae bacterium]|nr:serpin family protein [Oscillospiraceae bacterium]
MKHLRSKALAAAAMLSVSLTGCGTGAGISFGRSGKTEELTKGVVAFGLDKKEPDTAFLQGQTAFALSLMQHAAAERAGRNILLSPYSLMQVLALTANGAAGETRAEMEQVLGGLPVSDLNGGLYAQQADARKSVLKTANSVWYRSTGNLSVKKDFLKTAVGYYDAEVYQAPFDESTRNDINSWCKEKTDGMIPDFLSDISSNAAMYLFNAAAFDAEWKEPFEDPSSGSFTAAGGRTESVSVMESTEGIYLEDAHASGFVKPYQNGYSFAAILPEEGLTPEDYLAMQTPESFRTLLTDVTYADVGIRMPQFSLTDKTELSGILQDMGMKKAFDDADFSEMADADNLYIGEVMQKTFIDVNTKGTKAAAVTEVEVDSAAPPQPEYYVELNRPFIYMIVDSETMLPVFTGILNAVNG